MKDRFIRVSNAYAFAGGHAVRLEQYELQGEVPASRSDPLERSKEVLAERALGALISGDGGNSNAPAGDLLARIWTAFGPPYEGRPDEQFRYTFLDWNTGLVFSVESWEAGDPRYTLAGTYEGSPPPPEAPDQHFRPNTTARAAFRPANDPSQLLLQNRAELEGPQKRLKESASAFEAFLAKKPLADCTLMVDTDFGLYRIGAKGGRPINEKASFGDAIDFYVDLVKRHGPTADVPVINLAEPQLQILLLWVAASEAERASRPLALKYARRAWQREVQKLSETIVLESNDQQQWADTWKSLSAFAAKIGIETPEARAELERLREPPAVPNLTSVEFGTLSSALWAKRASPHWSEADRLDRATKDKETAARGPEFDPVRIVARLANSPTPADRHAAAQLQRALTTP